MSSQLTRIWPIGMWSLPRWGSSPPGPLSPRGEGEQMGSGWVRDGWRYEACGLAAAERGGGILELGVGDVGWEDGDNLAALDLDGRHRLGDVGAAAIELELAVEGHHVQVRQGVAHLLRVNRAGLLDSELEGKAAGGGLGGLVRRLDIVLGLIHLLEGRRGAEDILALVLHLRRPL